MSWVILRRRQELRLNSAEWRDWWKKTRPHRHDIPKTSRKWGTLHKTLLKIGNDPAETRIRRVSNRCPEFYRDTNLLGESLREKLHLLVLHIILNQHHRFMPVRQFVGCFLTSRLVRWLAGQWVSRLHQEMLPASKSSWVSIINPIKFPLPKFEKSNEVKDFSLIIPITILYLYLTYNRTVMNIQNSKQGKWRRRVIQKMNRGDLSLGTRHILIALCTCAVSSSSPL